MKDASLIPVERIEKAIYLICGEKVMLDRDLADLYGVLTKAFNQAVKRHKDRFPPDFMFQLTEPEAQGVLSRSQSVTLKRGQNIKYLPYAFTVTQEFARRFNEEEAIWQRYQEKRLARHLLEADSPLPESILDRLDWLEAEREIRTTTPAVARVVNLSPLLIALTSQRSARRQSLDGDFLRRQATMAAR